MSRRTRMLGLSAALGAALVFTVYSAIFHGPASLLSEADLIVLVALAAGAGAIGMEAFIKQSYRQALERLGSALGQFRESPFAKPVTRYLGSPEEELADLLAPIDGLCTAYRQALAEHATKTEALASLRTLLSQLDVDRGSKLTVRSSGSSRNMVARLTPNLFWTAATPALQSFLHCRMSDLNGKPFAELVHADDVKVAERAFAEAFEAGEAHHVTFRVLPRNGAGNGAGAEQYVNMDVQTRYTEQGEPMHLRCHFTDVTDKVRAEQEVLRRTEELSQTNDRLRQINEDLERLKESYRDLYHKAPAMYFSLDTRGHFVTFNETLLRTLGYEREDLSRQPYTRLLPPESLRIWQEHDAAGEGRVTGERDAATGEGRMTGERDEGTAGDPSPLAPHPSPLTPHALSREGEVETRWQKKDGTVIDVWIRTIPIQDENGRFVRSRSAAQDVTERNRLSNELRARRDELERANADLRLINRELEEFTSVVSHDLKEPLRTLQAFSNFLAEDYSSQLGPDGFQYINHLVQASKRLGKLIDDLLTLSRAGRMTPDLESFNLIEIVAIVRRDLADMVGRKEADLIVVGSLPTVIGDPQRITQLLSNLVGNGLKYNTDPKPQVMIGQVADVNGAVAKGTRGGPAGKHGHDYVTLYVKDNGIGIDPRYYEQIFKIFRRLHQPEEYEGTGAGLAICKKIVEAHAGRIWVESTPGQGSTFYFTLPRAPVEDPDAAAAAAPATSEPASRRHDRAARQRNPHILLVEDMPDVAMIAQKLSQRAQHQVTWLRTGEEAWDFLQTERPDLLLLDIHLPGMSGVELCQRLRTLGHLETMPIALFTQGDEGESWRRKIGADHVLSKDLLCRPEAWLNRLDEILPSPPAPG